MHELSFEEALKRIQAKDPRYHQEAYAFVREALDHTQKAIARSSKGRARHISGQELLAGIREFALTQFGPMAMSLLEEWGVHSCEDFGDIVFNMVEVGWLATTEKDSHADFQGGYDFFETFRKPYLPAGKRVRPERVAARAPSAKV